MATMKRGDHIGALICDVEALAKRLRAGITKRAKAAGMPKDLQTAAKQLRKQAATVAAQVEKYVHEIRRELEGAAKPARRAKTKRRKPAMAPVV
jgi:hypothetical protein